MSRKLTLFFYALLSISYVYAQDRVILTLEDVLEDTKIHYPYLEQEKVLQNSVSNINKSLFYAYIPQLSLNGNVQYQSQVPEIAVNVQKQESESSSPLVDGMIDEVIGRIEMPEIPKLQYSTYVQVTQLIWSGQRVSTQGDVSRAKIAVQSAENQLEFEKVRKAVTELYFSLLMVDAQSKIQDTFISELERQKKIALNAKENGVLSQNDIDEIELSALRATQQKDRLTESRSSLMRLLSLYTGKSYDNKLTDTSLPTIPMEATVSVGGEGGRFAFNRRAHYLLDTQQTLAEATYRSHFSEMMPTIAAFAQGGYGRPGMNFFSDKGQPYFVYGLTFSWNLGKLYYLKSRRVERDNTLRIIDLKRKAFELNAKAEVEQAKSEAEQYQHMVQQDSKLTELQHRISDRSELQYKEGTLTLSDRLSKLSALNVAEQTKEVHQIQWLRAMYMLQIALGN